MNSLIQKKSDNYTIEILKESLSNVREDMKDNPYIIEAIKVLSVDGYRSSIGLFWNAVIDDLRNKIMFRSLTLFNKEMKLSVKTYEDFQNFVNDDQLIDGAAAMKHIFLWVWSSVWSTLRQNSRQVKM